MGRGRIEVCHIGQALVKNVFAFEGVSEVLALAVEVGRLASATRVVDGAGAALCIVPTCFWKWTNGQRMVAKAD